MEHSTYFISPEELQEIAELAGIPYETEINETESEELLEEFEEEFEAEEDEEAENASKFLIHKLGEIAFSMDGEAFSRFVSTHRERISEAAESNPAVSRILVLGFKLGISEGNASCMNDLGYMYYMGNFVEQDYPKAAELYEMAMENGCYQSILNLGYMYEHGRLGFPDYAQAYHFYSLAVALNPTYNALFKMGDMYARGRGVKQNKRIAMALWERSLAKASSTVEKSQPSFRIAQAIEADDWEDYGVERDLIRALKLYQKAEIGMRVEINNWQNYYADRLQEAIKGQERVRALIENEM